MRATVPIAREHHSGDQDRSRKRITWTEWRLLEQIGEGVVPARNASRFRARDRKRRLRRPALRPAPGRAGERGRSGDGTRTLASERVTRLIRASSRRGPASIHPVPGRTPTIRTPDPRFKIGLHLGTTVSQGGTALAPSLVTRKSY